MSQTAWTGPAGHRRDYEITDLVPIEGGQGFVFRGRLRSTRLGPELDGAEVALKQLASRGVRDGATAGPDPALDSVLRARVHPGLARQIEVFLGPAPDGGQAGVGVGDGDAGDGDGLVYVVSGWVDGRPLRQAARGQPLAAQLRWVRQLAEAIDFLHAEGPGHPAVVHRDVKPGNVLVTATSDAVLIDPGLARLAAAGATSTPHGSPGFIPPECRADPTASGPAGDRWQLGATLATLVLGDPPGAAEPDEVRSLLARRLASTHRSWPLAEAMAAMLDPDPGRRPARATDWAVELVALERLTRRRYPAPGRRRAGRRRVEAPPGRRGRPTPQRVAMTLAATA
ncbi:MAG: protein kinase domain-containing protein, partial [Acidimicrobiales bacterium]